MVQINEYAIALILLALSAVALAVQIYDWTGFKERRELTGAFKTVGFLFVAALLIFWAALFVKIKGSKPWSNLLLNEGQPLAQSQPTPAPPQTPNPTPHPTVVLSPTATPIPSPSPVAAPSVITTPTLSASNTPASVKQELPTPQLPSDTKIGLLQCSVSEYDHGYKVIKGATCIAKHQQTGLEFIGTVGSQGMADINVPYGFYVVTIKAEGYITRVEAVKVGEEAASVVVELQRERQ
jgi:hypothetical protein